MPLNLDQLVNNQDASTSQTYFNRLNFNKVATATSQSSGGFWGSLLGGIGNLAKGVIKAGIQTGALGIGGITPPQPQAPAAPQDQSVTPPVPAPTSTPAAPEITPPKTVAAPAVKPPAPFMPSFTMPVSDTTSPFAKITPQHITGLGDATSRGDSMGSYILSGQNLPKLKPGQKLPTSSATASLGIAPAPNEGLLDIGAAASGFESSEVLSRLAGTLSGTQNAIDKNAISGTDIENAPLDTKIAYSIGQFGANILDFSAIGQVLNGVLPALKLATAGPDGEAILKFTQGARIAKATSYLTENFPTISKFIFGGEGTAAAMQGALNNAVKLAASMNILDQVDLSFTGADAKTRLQDALTTTITSGVLGMMGLARNPYLSAGSNFAYGYASAKILNHASDEDAFIQGNLWMALDGMGRIKGLSKGQIGDQWYQSSIDNLKSTMPEVAPDIDKLDSVMTAMKEGGLADLDTLSSSVNDILTKIDTAIDSKKKVNLQGIDPDKVIASLKQSTIPLGDILQENGGELLKTLESKDIETETGKVAMGGEDLVGETAGMHGAEGERQSVGLDETKPLMTPVRETGVGAEDRLKQAIEYAIGGDISEPSEERGKKASIQDKSRARLFVSSDPDLSDDQRAQMRKLIDSTTSNDTLRSMIDKITSSLAKNAVKAWDGGKISDLNYGPVSPDVDRLRGIIDEYKKSGGTTKDLAKAIVDSIGEDAGKNASNVTRIANSVIGEYRMGSLDQFKKFLDGNAGDRMEQLDWNRDAVRQKVADTIHFDKAAPVNTNADKESIQNPGKEVKTPNGGTVKIDFIPATAAESNETVTGHMDMESQLADIIGSSLRQEQLPRGTKGAAVGSDLALMKAYYAGTALHEVGGHNLDSFFNITDGLKDDKSPSSDAIIKELIDNWDPERKKQYKSKSDWLPEAFADYARSFFNGEDITDHPLTTQYFQSTVKGEKPEMWAALSDVRQQAIDYTKAPALAQAQAAESRNSKNFFDSFKNKVKRDGLINTIGDWAEGAYKKQLNNRGYFHDVDRRTGATGRDSLEYGAIMMQRMESGIQQVVLDYGVPKDINDILVDHKTPAQIQKENGFVTRPLKEIFNAPADAAKGGWSQYIHAREFEERAKQDETAGIKRAYPSTYSPENIAAIKDSIEGKDPKAASIAQEWADVQRTTRDFQSQSGAMKKEDVMKLGQNDRFVRLTRAGGFFENDFADNKRSSTIRKSYRGSEREDLTDAYQGILSDVNANIHAAVSQNFKSKLLDAATVAPSTDVRTITPPMSVAARLSPEEIVSKYENEVGEIEPEDRAAMIAHMEQNPDLLNIFRPNTTGDRNIIQVKDENGNTKYLRVNDGIADFMNAFHKSSDVGNVVKAFHVASTLKRYTSTIDNPGFLWTHFSRNIETTGSSPDASLFLPVHAWDTVKELVNYAKNINHPGNDDHLDTAVAYGAIQKKDVMGDDAAEWLNKLVDVDKNKGKNIVSNVFGKFNNMMQSLISATDNAGRMAIFRKFDITDPDELAKGLQAMVGSGIDWNQHGRSDSAVEKWNYVDRFFRAGLLAKEKSIKALADPMNLVRMSPIMLASIATAILNQNNEQYANLPISRQVSSINIPLPGNKIFTIPFGNFLPFSLYWSMPQAIYFGLKNKDPKMALDLGRGLLASFLDTNVSNNMTASGLIDSAASNMPDLLRMVAQPFLDAESNKYSSGATVMPAELQGLDPQLQYTESTSEAAITISKFLNSASGGFVNVSPIYIDDGLQTLGTGSYDFLSKATDDVAVAAGVSQNSLQKQVDAADIPFLNRFVHDAYSPGSQYYVQRMFDNYGSDEQANKSYNNLRKTNPQAAEQYKKDNAKAISNWNQYDKPWYVAYKRAAVGYRTAEQNNKINPDLRNAQMNNMTDGLLNATMQDLNNMGIIYYDGTKFRSSND